MMVALGAIFNTVMRDLMQFLTVTGNLPSYSHLNLYHEGLTKENFEEYIESVVSYLEIVQKMALSMNLDKMQPLNANLYRVTVEAGCPACKLLPRDAKRRYKHAEETNTVKLIKKHLDVEHLMTVANIIKEIKLAFCDTCGRWLSM